MQSLLYIYWNVDPEIFRIGGFSLRYYGLFFVLAFVGSYWLLQKVFEREGISTDLLTPLSMYIFLGTLIGARLGHTLFYEFDYYKHHLLEIILPFKINSNGFEFTGYQGLASHGGAIGILIAVVLFCKKYHQSILWLLDRLVIAVALAGFFIRLGNLFNSEIIGKPTEAPWAFIFERIDLMPRHPAQLYEAILYLLLFFILWMQYRQRTMFFKEGFLFGYFLMLLFSVRFFIEFLKEDQVAFESGMILNMGQYLSLPFIALGMIIVLVKAKPKSGNSRIGNESYSI